MSGADDLKVKFETKAIQSGFASIVEEFKTRGGNIGELTPVIAEEMVVLVVENFEKERGFKQGDWPDLADSTKAARRESATFSILRDTGVLFGSIQQGARSDAESAEVFTNVPYAIYHVSKQPRSKIPLRDFFDIDMASLIVYTSELILAELGA